MLILEATYKGFDKVVDAKIRKAAKRPSDGSGFLIPSGIRDLTFPFSHMNAAKQAKNRLAKIKGVKVRFIEEHED